MSLTPHDSEERPWLFTCRHTYEDRLVEECERLGCGSVVAAPSAAAGPSAATDPPTPGLVVALGLPPQVDAVALAHWDPVWALQVLPAAQRIQAPSINRLGAAVAEQLVAQLDGFEGSWMLHPLVAGMLKGQPKPKLERRVEMVIEAAGKRIAKTHRRAWRRRVLQCQQPDFVAQLFLQDPETAWLSAVQPVRLATGGTWPSALPAGLAVVADDPVSPSSAFRKLDEAFACMGAWPAKGQHGVDLGASPGGWTRVLLRHGAHVTAVDRAPLAAHLMHDERCTWIKGDAFAYLPEQPVDWLVSDIIAFPERVAELLDTWCSGHWAAQMVVQMKFKGATDWPALDAALAVGRQHGYAVRARHFFNDKNELTLMLRDERLALEKNGEQTAQQDVG